MCLTPKCLVCVDNISFYACIWPKQLLNVARVNIFDRNCTMLGFIIRYFALKNIPDISKYVLDIWIVDEINRNRLILILTVIDM